MVVRLGILTRKLGLSSRFGMCGAHIKEGGKYFPRKSRDWDESVNGWRLQPLPSGGLASCVF